MEEVRIEVELLERDEKGAPGDDLWAAAFRAVKRLRGEQAEA